MLRPRPGTSNPYSNPDSALYLVHWPVIVILGSMMESGIYFYVVVLALSFGLAIASYHFVKNQWRRADWAKIREAAHLIPRGQIPARAVKRVRRSRSAGPFTVGLVAYAQRAVAPKLSPLRAADPAIAVRTTLRLLGNTDRPGADSGFERPLRSRPPCSALRTLSVTVRPAKAGLHKL
jgi:hypothetical protein